MADENGSKTADTSNAQLWPMNNKSAIHLVVALLRITAMLGAATAALLMGFSRQSRMMSNAVVGTTHIYQIYTAEFQQNPALVYFVVANTIASVYNMMVLSIRPFFGDSVATKVAIHQIDMVILSLMATGAAAATSIAVLAKSGNKHTRWNPICNKFDEFCLRGGLAIIACYIGAVLQLMLNGVSTVTLHWQALKPPLTSRLKACSRMPPSISSRAHL